jgi:hypothetical protein
MPKSLENKFYGAKKAYLAFNNILVPSPGAVAARKQWGKYANEVVKKYHAPKLWKFSNVRHNAESVLETEKNRLRNLVTRNIIRRHFPPGVFQPINTRYY